MVTFDLPKGHILNLDKIEKTSICGMKKKKTISEPTNFAQDKWKPPEKGILSYS